MSTAFFEHPILNSPYDYPVRHWELDASGQPTQQIAEFRRKAEFIIPIPKPKKRKTKADQTEIVFDEGKGLSTKERHVETRQDFFARDPAHVWKFRIPMHGSMILHRAHRSWVHFLYTTPITCLEKCAFVYMKNL